MPPTFNNRQFKALHILDTELQTKRWTTDVNSIAPHLGVRYVLEKDNRWSLNIVLDQETTQEQFEQFWYLFLEKRDDLAKFQGRDTTDYFRSILYDLIYEKYVNKYEIVFENQEMMNIPSYKKPRSAELAMDINFDLLVYFIRGFRKTEEVNRSKLAINYIDNILHSFISSKDEFDSIISEAKPLIQNGECPFDIKNYPIDVNKIREKIRYLKRFTFVEGQDLSKSKKTMLSVYSYFNIWGDWQTGMEYLKRSFPLTYEKYKPRYTARLTQLCLDCHPGIPNDLSFP